MKNSKEANEPKQNTYELKNAEPKQQGNKLRHDYNKRRKEGEEKAHEDGGMVG